MIGQNGRCPSPTASPAAIRTTVPGNKVPAETGAISTGPNRSREYLHGIDLFNHGFYWGAHEAWEGLWVACGRRGPTATYLQALNLAAAGFKARV
jgi:Domain of unknown function (DUF309)